MPEKVCSHCTRLLALDAFAPKRAMCRECQAFKRANWYASNKQRLRQQRTAYMKGWRKRNPGYDSRKTPQTYNPQKQQQYRRKYRAKPGVVEDERAKLLGASGRNPCPEKAPETGTGDPSQQRRQSRLSCRRVA